MLLAPAADHVAACARHPTTFPSSFTPTLDPAQRDSTVPSRRHSHSMVPGGFEVTSSVTRLTSATSLVIRVEIFSSTSNGSRAQSAVIRSEEHTSELQSLMRISYAVFCLKKKKEK